MDDIKAGLLTRPQNDPYLQDIYPRKDLLQSRFKFDIVDPMDDDGRLRCLHGPPSATLSQMDMREDAKSTFAPGCNTYKLSPNIRRQIRSFHCFEFEPQVNPTVIPSNGSMILYHNNMPISDWQTTLGPNGMIAHAMLSGFDVFYA